MFGGLEEIRTPDPHNANVVRSQLRYKPVPHDLLYVRQPLLSSKNYASSDRKKRFTIRRFFSTMVCFPSASLSIR